MAREMILADFPPAQSGTLTPDVDLECTNIANAIESDHNRGIRGCMAVRGSAGTLRDIFRDLRARGLDWGGILAKLPAILAAIAAGLATGNYAAILIAVLQLFFPVPTPVPSPNPAPNPGATSKGGGGPRPRVGTLLMMIVAFVVLLVVGDTASACGPGRAARLERRLGRVESRYAPQYATVSYGYPSSSVGYYQHTPNGWTNVPAGAIPLPMPRTVEPTAKPATKADTEGTKTGFNVVCPVCGTTCTCGPDCVCSVPESGFAKPTTAATVYYRSEPQPAVQMVAPMYFNSAPCTGPNCPPMMFRIW